MPVTTTPNVAPEMPSFAPKLYGIALIVTCIVLAGLWLVARYTEIDYARDLQNWQEKLNLIAESHAPEIDEWVAGNFKDLRALADNPSLQLYMTEMQTAKTPGENNGVPAAASEPPQQSYLRNLLIFTADRAGYGAATKIAEIPANMPPESKGGLAIIDSHNKIVVSTLAQSSVRDAVLKQAADLPPAQESLIDMRKYDDDGQPYIGFSVPIYSIQGGRDAASQIGRIVGIKQVGKNLFSLLDHPGVTEKTFEIILARKNADKIEYLSPLLDGTTALNKQDPFDTVKLAGANLIATPGNFIKDKNDYRDKPVLATSRAIAGTPWTMIVKIDRHEALAESAQRRAGMVVMFFLLIAIIVLVIISVWWHAYSKRSLALSTHFKALAARSSAQAQLVRLVADNQPESIYIMDASHVVHFANKQAAVDANMTPENINDKTLSDVRGGARAAQLIEQADKALAQGHIVYDIKRVPSDKGERTIRGAYVPLDHIPLVTLPDHTPGVLVVEQDISEAVREREQRLKTQTQLIGMLVKLVDNRDPFAANHSQLVSEVAHEVAIDMELDNVTVETTKTAGSLMNIGKIIVPSKLLTSSESITPDERRIIRESMTKAADMLSGIDFDGPVVDTLRQWQEKWDGTGPLGLKGEAILISARIIAVVNAFIGMISPRSWRSAMTIEAAASQLLEQSDTHFDRRAVIALINFIENHHGRELLTRIQDKTRDLAV